MRLHTGLPVENALDELENVLRTHPAAILCADPGAGKSTVVPPSLLDAPFLDGGKILMLEPRRIAAVGAAKRIAFLLGEKVGQTAGYRTRFGSETGPSTRIEVITEGILTRMIQHNPELPGVKMLIFDEFHERSLQADLGLALALDVREALRDDLKILVMSATLDSRRISRLLGNAPVVKSEGRVFPVETLHRPPEGNGFHLEKIIASNVVFALNSHPGDILVFLPGEFEIKLAIEELRKVFPDADAQKLLFLPLYGNLPEREQDLALTEAEKPFRKVILSTPVAESSVTVPGVRIVIDSGWMRVPRFSPANAMNKLETVRVSLASADQRRGRAARTGPGLCIRLWSPSEERAFPPFGAPEILEADLASFCLELAKWGLRPDNISSLRWLDEPPRAKVDQAFALLAELEAVTPDAFRLTKHGERLLEYPMHPRLAHMIACAETLHAPALGCAVAAILSERDFLRAASDSDLKRRLSFLLPDASESAPGIDRNALRRVKSVFRQLSRSPISPREFDLCGVLLAKAYPDRIAKARAPHSGEYTLSNGVQAKLLSSDDMRLYEYLCAPIVEGTGKVPTIFLSAEITPEAIEKHFRELISEEVSAVWNDDSKSLSVSRIRRLGSLALSQKSLPAHTPDLPPEMRLKVFLDGIRKCPLPWSARELSLMQRISFLHRALGDEWPDLSPETLSATLEEWLAPFLTERSNSLESLRGGTLANAFDNLVGHARLRQLDTLAPERITVPSGSSIRVDYDTDPPRLPVRLQEVFGMTATPKLAGGRVPLVMDLLSPAMRTVQITADLAHFWANSYFLVRKDMRGRYPRHDWPENPLEALPHRGSKKPRSNF